MANRPPTISIKDLSNAVDKAVKVASDKHKVQFGPDFRIGPGTILGRQLLQAETSLKQAEQIATEITQQATAGGPAAQAFAGGHFEPTVLVGRGIIICGMLPGPIFELQ